MKQHITEEQWGELTEAERAKFIEWTASKGPHAVTVRSIGHLLWFLDDHGDETCSKFTEQFDSWDGGFISWEMGTREWRVQGMYSAEELIDALWESVKAALKRAVSADAN